MRTKKSAEVRWKKSTGPLKDLYRCGADIAPQIARGIFSRVVSPMSLSMKSSLESGDYMTIVSATVDPSGYTNADTFRQDYLCAELMSKYPEWDLGINRSEAALAKFRDSEELCARTNRTVATYFSGKVSETSAILFMARRKIDRLLKQFCYDELADSFDWGPGASTSLPRRYSDASYKFGAEVLHATASLLPFIDPLQRHFHPWEFSVEVVAGSKGTTVPKNAKTDRFIALEPDLNMFVQKGIGNMIRRRLQKVGILTPDAQMKNQALAREGSITGEFATIDLSSASDTIALRLVEELLPQDWLQPILMSRSSRCTLPTGEVFELQKVSSMGNGFTFELETLIFWALSSSVIEIHRCREHRCLVYGDDIIVPSSVATALIECLSDVGFTTNIKKTFSSGPFRESCGKHYFQGVDVTPFYIRGPVKKIEQKYLAANQVREWSRLPVYGLDPLLYDVYNDIVEHIPAFFRQFKIPADYGDDIGLVVDLDEATPSWSQSKGRGEGWRFRCLRRRTRSFYNDTGNGTLLKALFSLEKRTSRERRMESQYVSEQRRNNRGGHVAILSGSAAIVKSAGWSVKTALTHQWPSFGPWIMY